MRKENSHFNIKTEIYTCFYNGGTSRQCNVVLFFSRMLFPTKKTWAFKPWKDIEKP